MKSNFKKVIYRITIICITIVMIFPIWTLGKETATFNSMSKEIQNRTDIKDWVYKVINGDLYKRLYNYSTGRWETDWIFVAEGRD